MTTTAPAAATDAAAAAKDFARRCANGHDDEAARELLALVVERGHATNDTTALGLAAVGYALLNLDLAVPVDVSFDSERLDNGMTRIADRLDDIDRTMRSL